MKVIIKEDSTQGLKNPFYFSDGGNNLSGNCSLLEAVQKAKFLKSLGIEIEYRCHDVYLPFFAGDMLV